MYLPKEKYCIDMLADGAINQVARLPRDPNDEPAVLAITSKQSAQRLLEGRPRGRTAGGLQDQGVYAYRVAIS
jgi:hypothetical protein